MKRILTATVVGLMCLGGTAGAQDARTPSADIVEARHQIAGVEIASIGHGVGAAEFKGRVARGPPSP